MKVIMTLGMLVDDRAEAVLRALDRTVNQRQLGDIVLVNHAEDGLLSNLVHLGVLNVNLSSRLLFVETIRRDELTRIMSRHSVDSSERLGDTRRRKAVDVGFKISLL